MALRFEGGSSCVFFFLVPNFVLIGPSSPFSIKDSLGGLFVSFLEVSALFPSYLGRRGASPLLLATLNDCTTLRCLSLKGFPAFRLGGGPSFFFFSPTSTFLYPFCRRNSLFCSYFLIVGGFHNFFFFFDSWPFFLWFQFFPLRLPTDFLPNVGVR